MRHIGERCILTIVSIPNTNPTPLDRAAKQVGGVVALARAIGASDSAPSMWKARGVVPVERCTDIERATGGVVTRRDLRPDDWHRIWPELVTHQHPAPAAVAAQGA